MREGWEYRKLGEVATFVTDGDWIESKDQSDKGIRLIQTGNIGNGIFKSKEDKPHFISEDTMLRLGCTEIYEGDCLVSRLPDPVGRACLIPNIGFRMITAVDCSIIRFGDNYIPQFFVDYSQSSKYRYSINNNTTGTTRKRISRKNLESIPIPVPPLSEQEHIVSELDLLSSIIEKKKAQLKEYDQLAQSIFYDMFGDPVTNEKGWKVKKLGEVVEITSRLINPNEIPFCNQLHVSPANIVSDTGEIKDCKLAKEENLISGKYEFAKGMVLYSKIRPNLNKVAIPSFDGVCSADMYPLAIKPIANNVYICKLLLSKNFLEYAIKHSGRARMPKLNREALFDYDLYLPPLYLQQSFASKIESIERQKELIKQSITELETLFDSRMDYWFA